MRWLYKYFCCFILLYTLVSCCRIFLLELFWVPSMSMEPTIKAESFILIEKISYGSLLPQSIDDIPWTNSILLISDNFKDFISKKRWNYKRVLQSRKIEKGDIAVFKDPDNNYNIVKRCIGLPGDTLLINQNKWYCNEEKCDYIDSLNYCYAIKNISNQLEEYIFDNRKTIFSKVINDSLTKLIRLKSIETDFFENQINKLNYEIINNIDSIVEKGFQHNVQIPRKGNVIEITNINFAFYFQIINKFENNTIKKEDSSFYINDIKTNLYTFENDYYFFLGDNRSNSIDSRHFSLIPTTQIIGKVLKVF